MDQVLRPSKGLQAICDDLKKTIDAGIHKSKMLLTLRPLFAPYLLWHVSSLHRSSPLEQALLVFRPPVIAPNKTPFRYIP